MLLLLFHRFEFKLIIASLVYIVQLNPSHTFTQMLPQFAISNLSSVTFIACNRIMILVFYIVLFCFVFWYSCSFNLSNLLFGYLFPDIESCIIRRFFYFLVKESGFRWNKNPSRVYTDWTVSIVASYYSRRKNGMNIGEQKKNNKMSESFLVV